GWVTRSPSPRSTLHHHKPRPALPPQHPCRPSTTDRATTMPWLSSQFRYSLLADLLRRERRSDWIASWRREQQRSNGDRGQLERGGQSGPAQQERGVRQQPLGTMAGRRDLGKIRGAVRHSPTFSLRAL